MIALICTLMDCIFIPRKNGTYMNNMYGTVTKIGNVHLYCDNMYIKSDRIQRKNILFLVFVFSGKAKSI